MVRAEWDQGQVPGALDGGRKSALMLGAHTGLAPGLDLPPVRHVPAEPIGVFVVDVLDVIDAESAYLSTAVVARSAAPAAEPSARSSSGSAAAGPSARPRTSGSWSSGSRSARTSAWPRTGEAARPGTRWAARSGACRWWSAGLCRHSALTLYLRRLDSCRILLGRRERCFAGAIIRYPSG